MSLDAFDHLRRKYPDEATSLSNLERVVRGIVRKAPNALLDERILAKKLGIAETIVQQFLVELVAVHELETTFLWACPQGFGTATEEADVLSFPDWLQCTRCGQKHWFSQSDIEVRFIASEHLRKLSIDSVD